MTPKTLWYLTEALFLAIYIAFFGFLANSIWIGIIAGVGIIVMRNLVYRVVKVGKE